MPSVSSLGVGTGIDLSSLLSKLVAAESVPITQLNTRQTSFKNQLSAIGRIQSAVETFASAAQDIATEAGFKGFSATVADEEYASASATGYAAPGSFSLRVEQLAQANKLLSSTAPSVSAGTLTLELGDISGGSFVAKSGTSPVTINFTGSTIEELRAAINDADIGISATIINGAGGKQLMLTSDETGVENTIRLTGSGGLVDLTYDPISPSVAFTEKSVAQDAEAYVEGVLVTSSTNTLSEAMTGVTLTLKKAHDPLQPTDATTLTIGNDNAGMIERIQAFVTAWNDLNSLSKELTKYDTTTQSGSVLTGDGTVSTVNNKLREVLFSSPSGISTAYPTLADLGISLQSDGSLLLDEDQFSEALAANLSGVSSTVTAFGSAFQSAAEALVDLEGTITIRQASLDTLIDNLETRREELQRRVNAVEARYSKQFTALDKLMSQLQTQSAYLTQQLASLG